MGKLSTFCFKTIDSLEPYSNSLTDAFRVIVKLAKKTWKVDCIVFGLICIVIFTLKSIFYHYGETNLTIGRSLSLAFCDMIVLVLEIICVIFIILAISWFLGGIFTTIVAKWADKQHIKYIEYKKVTEAGKVDNSYIKNDGKREEVRDVLEENNASDSKLETDLKVNKSTSKMETQINGNKNEVTSLNPVTINVNIENKFDVSHFSGLETSSAGTKPEDKVLGKTSAPSMTWRNIKEHPKLDINETLLKAFFENYFIKEKLADFIIKLKSVEEKYSSRDYGKLAVMMTYAPVSIRVLLENYKKVYGKEVSINFGKFVTDFYAAIGIKCSSTNKVYYEEALEKVKQDFEEILNYKCEEKKL